MISITIDGLGKVAGLIGQTGKQARFAAALALTRTAKAIETDLKRDTETKLDNPSPWISRSGTFITPAKKDTLTATVGFKDRQALYMKEHFNAGLRGQKPYEKALAAMGILPSGYRAVPGAHLKLDMRGIPNRGQLREIFGSLASRMQVAKGRGKKVRMEGYFAIPVGASSRLAAGIWWRAGRAIRPVMLFVRQAGYRKVLDLGGIATTVVGRDFDRLFSEAMAQAMDSAR